MCKNARALAHRRAGWRVHSRRHTPTAAGEQPAVVPTNNTLLRSSHLHGEALQQCRCRLDFTLAGGAPADNDRGDAFSKD